MEMILLIGLQAAGKSTFYRMHFAATHQHISKDLLRNNKRPARRERVLIEEALQEGHSIVVDNTNPSREERESLIQLGRSYGATIIGYYFEPQVAQSLERNKQREGKERVPDIAIFATRKRLVAPVYAEGYDRLFCVRNEGEMKFTISVYPEEEGEPNG